MQLRLVEPPAPVPPAPKSARGQSRSQTGKQPRKATLAGVRLATPARQVSWGEWRLDARTRSVGRAGVAAARRALEEAATASEQLSRAS